MLGPAVLRPDALDRLPRAFTHSRLLKHKAGPGVAPATFAIEGDLAESWSQPNETTYVSWGGILVGPPLFGLLVHLTDSYRTAWLALAVAASAVAVTLPRLQPLVQRDPVSQRAA